MTAMSDEIKLAILQDQLKNITMGVKMMITIQATFEAQRQYMAGILPDELKDVPETDDFKNMYLAASEAYNEVVRNMTIFVDNMTQVFDYSFADTLPTDKEGFQKMAEELSEQVDKYNEIN